MTPKAACDGLMVKLLKIMTPPFKRLFHMDTHIDWVGTVTGTVMHDERISRLYVTSGSNCQKKPCFYYALHPSGGIVFEYYLMIFKYKVQKTEATF